MHTHVPLTSGTHFHDRRESFLSLSNKRWLTPKMGNELGADLQKAAAMLRTANVLLGVYGTARDHAILPETVRGISALIEGVAREHPEIGVLTGGGPGSMRVATQLANKFATAFAIKAGELSGEKVDEEYSGGLMVANHMMWTRRFLLTTLPAVVLGTPGGIGTMHEQIEHAFLQGRGLISSSPAVCLDTPGGLFGALKGHIRDKVLPFETAAMQSMFPKLWRVVNPGDEGGLRREGEALASRVDEAMHATSGAGGPRTPNSKWFTPRVLEESQHDLNDVLALFDQTKGGMLRDASFVSIMGDLGRFGDHAVDVLRRLSIPNATVLTDDPRGREIATSAGLPSFTLVNDHDGAGYPRGISVDGEHVKGTISHLVCAKRFVLTTAASAVLAYPGDLHTLDKILELTVLHQLGLLRSQTIACVDSNDYYGGLVDFGREHLEKGHYSKSGDLDVLQRVDADARGSAERVSGILQGF